MPQLRLSEITLDYDVHGPDDGIPLLLVMGLGMQRTAWPPSLLDALARRGMRCITFDNRDVGLSTRYDQHRVPAMGRLMAARLFGLWQRLPYRLSDIAGDGIALLDHLGIARAHVLGISMGGMVAQHLAARHGERVQSLSLVATSSGRLGLPPPAVRVMKLLLSRPTRRSSLEAATNYLVDMFSAIGSPDYQTPRHEIERRAKAGLMRAANGDGVARQLAAIISDGDRTPMLRRLQMPTLILHGEHDAMVPLAHGRQLARVIPGARLHTIRGWGHDLPDALSNELATLIAGHASPR